MEGSSLFPLSQSGIRRDYEDWSGRIKFELLYNHKMISPIQPLSVVVLNVSGLSYAQQLCAAALQGLVNRDGPVLFLDYGIYDDPAARRTNEVFLDDDIWFGKFRDLLGNQDQRNLEYYQQAHGVQVHSCSSLEEVVTKFQGRLKGCAVWDAALPDTVNIALMLAAREDLLVVEGSQEDWAHGLGLETRHDLRGKWQNRIELYEWAFENLFPTCKAGQVACVEPGWQRPEFVDYLVQQKIFTYSLSSKSSGAGDRLLLLLAFGPPWLRELIFALRLDAPIRRLGLKLMERKSAEVRLSSRILRAVRAAPYPTIFGWHTTRDDELALMLHISANGLRLVPAHLAGNISFHSQVPPLGMPALRSTPALKLDPQGTYITFTLSDGDQLMMMNSGELGNWYSPLRGSLPFNWETQPLLVELAPALFEKYARSASPKDCLIAGPSGAGYIIPPLAPDLPAYLKETSRICRQAGIRVATFYVPDPPQRVFRQLKRHAGGLVGFLAGYAVLSRTPQVYMDSQVFVANRWPPLNRLWDSAADLLAGVENLVLAPGPRPRFIGVHLFAYRTTLADVANWAANLKDEHVHIVRGDDFLQLAGMHLRTGGKPHE